jgi:hypothetical protein
MGNSCRMTLEGSKAALRHPCWTLDGMLGVNGTREMMRINGIRCCVSALDEYWQTWHGGCIVFGGQ